MPTQSRHDFSTQIAMSDNIPLLCRDYFVHKRSLFKLRPSRYYETNQAKWEIHRRTLLTPCLYLRNIYTIVEKGICYGIDIL